ncbi:MAG: beta-N-acetylhexosaminidase, partial [Lysobacterales bacterium]
VGGVVLFTRNFTDRKQLVELVAAIRDTGEPRPLICIDQEGGRVQRLREGFTLLPALGVLGQLYATERDRAVEFAYRHARVMAAEMLACGIDLSFAPILDLDRGSSVIGNRSFSASTGAVVHLGRAYLAGMHDAGMKTTGKHYPGHGSVSADSHTDDVSDQRSLAELESNDLLPFTELSEQLDALMIAHVVYPQVDSLPAGYSGTWLRGILRESAGYRGVIISDDLGMHAARVAGGLAERCAQCLSAGCDLALVCRPEDVEELLGRIEVQFPAATHAITSLYGECRLSHAEMVVMDSPVGGEWRQWQESLQTLGKNGA